jgi:hypothetical protein
MIWNPYVIQAALQEGISPAEVQRTATRCCITDDEARKRGYDTAEEYEEALHDFLNGM